MAPQLAASCLITPDVLINRLVAHAALHEFEAANDADNLFRRLLLAEEATHDGKIPFGIVPVTPGPSPPGDGSSFGPRIAITIIAALASIARQLPANRTAVPAHLASDLGWIEALLLQV